jgi:hypothetical protein
MNNGSKFRLIVGIGGMILGALIGADFAVADDLGNPGVVPPNSNEFGNPYGEWSGRWWQWLVSIPEATNPNLDTTGANCDKGQSGQVWFLAGTFGDKAYTRRCTIPGGNDLLVTPFTTLDGELGPKVGDCSPNQCDINVLRELAAAGMDNPQSLEVTVDNSQVNNLDQYRVTSPVFDATFPKGAIFKIPPGLHGPLVSDGYFVLLKPLSPGMHTIHLKGVANGGGFVSEVTYHLTVTK